MKWKLTETKLTILYFRAICIYREVVSGTLCWVNSFWSDFFFVSYRRYGEDWTLLKMMWMPLIFWFALDRLLFHPLSISQFKMWKGSQIRSIQILSYQIFWMKTPDSVSLWISMFWDLPLFALFQLDSPRLRSWCRWAAEACLISSVSNAQPVQLGVRSPQSSN